MIVAVAVAVAADVVDVVAVWTVATFVVGADPLAEID